MVVAKSNTLNLLEARNQIRATRLPTPAPPTCQVEEQEQLHKSPTIKKGKGTIRFIVPSSAKSISKLPAKYARRKSGRHAAKLAAMKMMEQTVARMRERHELALKMEETKSNFNFNQENANPNVRPKILTGTHDQKVRAGIALGTIPSAVVDSGTTSHIGTEEDEEELIPTN